MLPALFTPEAFYAVQLNPVAGLGVVLVVEYAGDAGALGAPESILAQACGIRGLSVSRSDERCSRPRWVSWSPDDGVEVRQPFGASKPMVQPRRVLLFERLEIDIGQLRAAAAVVGDEMREPFPSVAFLRRKHDPVLNKDGTALYLLEQTTSAGWCFGTPAKTEAELPGREDDLGAGALSASCPEMGGG